MTIRIVALLALVFFAAGFQCCGPCPPASPFDFDHDDKSDLSIYRPSSGDWWIRNSATGQPSMFKFGLPDDIIVPADYTGDHKTDIAVFRSGDWYVLRSEDFTHYQVPFGIPGDVPTPADYEVPALGTNGRADMAVYRPSEGMWYINGDRWGLRYVRFGTAEDRPVVADYDGDWIANVAVFRPSTSEWYILGGDMMTTSVVRFGLSTDKTVPADYTGDKKADIGVFRPPTGEWFILRSEDGSYYSFKFGLEGDMPFSGDYDGDGKMDAAVFRPDDGMWYIYCSQGSVMMEHWGMPGDLPAPNAYVK